MKAQKAAFQAKLWKNKSEERESKSSLLPVFNTECLLTPQGFCRLCQTGPKVQVSLSSRAVHAAVLHVVGEKEASGRRGGAKWEHVTAEAAMNAGNGDRAATTPLHLQGAPFLSSLKRKKAERQRHTAPTPSQRLLHLPRGDKQPAE